MLTERLRARCPSAQPIGTAVAHNYDIQFKKESRDGSGKATLVETEGSAVQGVLFRINKTESGDLDIAEGVRDGGYERKNNFQVTHENNEITVTTYIAPTDKHKSGLPLYDWYFALVIAGARQHKLPNEYVDRLLNNNNCEQDQDNKRPQRMEALDSLEQAGYKTVYLELVERCV